MKGMAFWLMVKKV